MGSDSFFQRRHYIAPYGSSHPGFENHTCLDNDFCGCMEPVLTAPPHHAPPSPSNFGLLVAQGNAIVDVTTRKPISSVEWQEQKQLLSQARACADGFPLEGASLLLLAHKLGCS